MVVFLDPCCYQKEGDLGHFQSVLARALCASCILARMRLVQEGFKAFTLQVPCDPNTRSINMAKKGAKKAAAEAPAPAKKAMKATDIPAKGG